jgi:hypothetical protein
MLRSLLESYFLCREEVLYNTRLLRSCQYIKYIFFFLSKSSIVFYRGHMACLPPSTGRLTPVENEASLEAKNAIALATSIASPGLPSA